MRGSVIYHSRKVFNKPDGLGLESTRTYMRSTSVVTTATGGLIVGSLSSFIPNGDFFQVYNWRLLPLSRDMYFRALRQLRRLPLTAWVRILWRDCTAVSVPLKHQSTPRMDQEMLA